MALGLENDGEQTDWALSCGSRYNQVTSEDRPKPDVVAASCIDNGR